MSEPDQVFSSVWDAIEDTPEDAEDMKMRASLLISLTEHIRDQGWTHEEAAARLDVPPGRIKDLLRDRIWLFQQDELAQMCRRAGCFSEHSGSEGLSSDEGEAFHRKTQ
jgi:predicted XRE-type DNA-binding protein